MTRLALGLALIALVGCKDLLEDDDGPPPPFVATAVMDGPMVKLHLECPRMSEITIDGGKVQTCFEMKLDTTIPAALIGAGKHEFVVTAKRRNGQRLTTKATLDIPASATGPYVVFDECETDYQDLDRVNLEVTGLNLCSTFHGARVKARLHATPRGKLTIGGKVLAVPDTGEVATIIDLTDAILAMSVDDFTASGLSAKSNTPFSVPWHLEVGSAKLDGAFSIAEASFESGKLYRGWLHDVVTGKIDRPKFVVAPPGERKTIVLVDADGRDLVATDHRGTVRDLDLVAIEKETGRKEAGTCAFEKTVAKRFGVDLEVTVANLADGKVVAVKAFPAPPGCPMFAMLDPKHPETAVRVDKKVVTEWLETLTTQ